MTVHIAALCLLVPSLVLAQDTSFVQVERLVFKSTILDEERRLDVVKPPGYDFGHRAYPVVVVLDADLHELLLSAVSSARFLAILGDVPEVLLVGVENGRDRSHDMSPLGFGWTLRAHRHGGGADAFADVLMSEVLPLVRTRYRTLPVTILAGHSLGGLFGVYLAATRPGAFNAIIAMSPSLWWNGKLIDGGAVDSSSGAAFADSVARSGGPRRLFATWGELEPDIASTTARFAARLDSIKPARLAFGHKYYPGASHSLTPVASLFDGLRFVFAPVARSKFQKGKGCTRDSAAALADLIAETERVYGDSARGLGMPATPPEEFLTSLGEAALYTTCTSDARAYYSRAVELYPGSAAAHMGLGDVARAEGEKAKAKAEYSRAITVMRDSTHPLVRQAREKIVALERPPVPSSKPRPPP